MEPIKDILPRVLLQDQGLPIGPLEVVRAYWPQTVGDVLAGHCTPASIRNGRLTVRVQEKGLMGLFESEPLQGQILAILRSEVREAEVRAIRFVQGSAEPS